MRSYLAFGTVFAFASTTLAVPAFSRFPGFSLDRRAIPSYGAKAYGYWARCADTGLEDQFSSLGCYNVVSNPKVRFLEFISQDNPFMTKNACFQVCKGRGTRYAAIKGGKQCACGNDLEGETTKSEECSSTCSDRQGKCGGKYTWSVYRDTTFKINLDDLDTDAAIDGYIRQGCYRDDPDRIVSFAKETQIT